MINQFAKEVLGGITKSTVSRNARRSMNWLFNKIKNEMPNVKQVSRPKVGRMYLMVYDAKTKDKLPYWDSNPCIILVDAAPGGFYGLNFHYLPIKERHYLLEQLVPFQKLVSGRSINNIAISYKKLLGLSHSRWKHCFKRYLFSHMRTKLIEVPMNEWINVIELPLAHFHKATATSVWKDRNRG